MRRQLEELLSTFFYDNICALLRKMKCWMYNVLSKSWSADFVINLWVIDHSNFIYFRPKMAESYQLTNERWQRWCLLFELLAWGARGAWLECISKVSLWPLSGLICLCGKVRVGTGEGRRGDSNGDRRGHVNFSTFLLNRYKYLDILSEG